MGVKIKDIKKALREASGKPFELERVVEMVVAKIEELEKAIKKK